MNKYLHTYRLYGPTQIEIDYQIGYITIGPAETGSDHLSGSLEFAIFAQDYKEAERRVKSGDFDVFAQYIISSLAYVFDTGLTLGRPYKLKKAGGSRHYTDGTFNPGKWEFELATDVFRYILSDLQKNSRLDRAIRWYNYGLSTQTDEDSLVAYWTGLESLVESQSNHYQYNQQEEQTIDQARKQILSQLGNPSSDRYKWVEGRLGQIKGGVQHETKDEAVQNLALEKLNTTYLSGISDICDVTSSLYNARNDIVHAGKTVANASRRRRQAKELLRELILAHTSRPYAGILDHQGHPRRAHTLEAEADDWLPIIFEFDPLKKLDENEIKRRATVIARDMRDGYGFLLRKFVGKNQPLEKSGNEYTLNKNYYSGFSWAN